MITERKEPSAETVRFVMARAGCAERCDDPMCDCAQVALDCEAFAAQAVTEERQRCVEILHDEGWLGRSEQRIAHPDPRESAIAAAIRALPDAPQSEET